MIAAFATRFAAIAAISPGELSAVLLLLAAVVVVILIIDDDDLPGPRLCRVSAS